MPPVLRSRRMEDSDVGLGQAGYLAVSDSLRIQCPGRGLHLPVVELIASAVIATRLAESLLKSSSPRKYDTFGDGDQRRLRGPSSHFDSRSYFECQSRLLFERFAAFSDRERDREFQPSEPDSTPQTPVRAAS